MIGTIVLLGLLVLGVWVFGSLALRIGGLFLVFIGVFGVLMGTTGALIVIALGAVAWVGGHWLYSVKHGFHKSPLAARVLESVPLRQSARQRVGTLGERCPETGKVKFSDADDAWEAVEGNQARYESGGEDYQLQRAYACPQCGWWHVTSQP